MRGKFLERAPFFVFSLREMFFLRPKFRLLILLNSTLDSLKIARSDSACRKENFLASTKRYFPCVRAHLTEIAMPYQYLRQKRLNKAGFL